MESFPSWSWCAEAMLLVGASASCSGGQSVAELPADSMVAASASSPCDRAVSGRDVPFVDVFFALSDACPSRRQAPGVSTTSVRLSRDDSGRVCLSGRVSDGWAELVVGLDGGNQRGDTPAPVLLQPLDAVAHGRTRFRFTLAMPPEPGLLVEAAFTVGEGCFPDCELHKGFFAFEATAFGPAPRTFDEPGSYSVPLVDFRAVPPFDTSRPLDTTHLGAVLFDVGFGDFAFCVTDLAFE